jgi:hypothetical protein
MTILVPGSFDWTIQDPISTAGTAAETFFANESQVVPESWLAVEKDAA